MVQGAMKQIYIKGDKKSISFTLTIELSVCNWSKMVQLKPLAIDLTISRIYFPCHIIIIPR